jgi:hypothetical protein
MSLSWFPVSPAECIVGNFGANYIITGGAAPQYLDLSFRHKRSQVIDLAALINPQSAELTSASSPV